MLTAEQIREALKDRNIRQVAKGAGLHSNSVYRMVRGEPPSMKTLQKLSDYLSGAKQQ